MANKEYTYEIKKGKDGLISGTIKVSPKKYTETKDIAIKQLAKDIKLPGFRKGKAPSKKIEQELGNEVLSETIKILLPTVSSEIIEKEELNPVTQLDYEIQKMSDGDGVEFSFKFHDYPEVKLGDFSKIKAERKVKEVTKKDIDEVMDRLFKDDKKPITDKKVKELEMDGVENKKQLTESIKKRLESINETQADREFESKLISEALKLSTIPLPDMLVEEQKESLVQSYLSQIKELDVDESDFLKAQGLTKESLEEQKKEEAEQKLKTEFLLTAIVRENNLMPTSEEIEAEISAIPDEQTKAQFDNERGRRYVLSVLIEQRAIKKLKELANKKK